MRVSPRLITGNSTGKPPISQTPRFTCSAMSRKCALHGVSSDQVLQMPITGLPSKTWLGRPRLRIQGRGLKPSRSCPPNHAALRKGFLFLGSSGIAYLFRRVAVRRADFVGFAFDAIP